MRVARKSVHVGLELLDPLDRHVVHVAVLHRPDHRHLHLDRHRVVLPLLEELDDALAAIDLGLRRRVELGAELREGGELAELREVALELPGDLLHRLELRRRADARHRDADRDRRPDALVEEIGLEEDLAVGDRDDVGRDVGGDVAGLRLDDRQRRQRAVAVLSRRRARRARAGGCAGRRRRRDTPRGPTAASAPATPGGRRRRASTDRRRRSARPCRCP